MGQNMEMKPPGWKWAGCKEEFFGMSKKPQCSMRCSSWMNRKIKAARRNKKQYIITKKHRKEGIQIYGRRHCAVDN